MQPTDKEIEAQARELLAAEFERYGDKLGADKARDSGYHGYQADGVTLRAIVAALRTARHVDAPSGWWCAECQKAPDATEVDFHERHIECGRVITNDFKPATPASASEALPVAYIDPRHLELTRGGSGFFSNTLRTPNNPGTGTVPLYLHPAPASGEGQQGDAPCRVCGGAQVFRGAVCRECQPTEWGTDAATQQQAGQAVAWINADNLAELQRGGPRQPVFGKRHLDVEVPLYTTPQTPDGYVLVPREPTPAMLHAAGRVVFAEAGAGIPMYDPLGFAEQTVTETQGKCYRAMISASEASGGEG